MSRTKRGGSKRKLGDANKDKIISTSAGRYSLCEQCGSTFEQDWMPNRGFYTTYKRCTKCRMNIARGKETAVIDYTPHEKQQVVHDSNARFKLMMCGARWGKDRCSIMEYIQKYAGMLSEERPPSMVPAVHGWVVAPNFTLARQTWRELKAYFPQEWVVNYWETDKTIQTINDGVIEIRSADDPDMLVGVGLDIVLITEAARINRLEDVWANLETRLMSPGRGPNGTGGLALINSTPRGRNYFYTMYRWGQEDDPMYDPKWESWRFPSYTNTYLTEHDIDFFNSLRKRYPDRVYKQEIEAIPLAEGNSVFPTADNCAVYEGPEDAQPHRTYTIGWDPARSADFSGVVIRNNVGEAVKIYQWTGRPWSVQVDEIERLAREYNYAHVVIDATGIGDTLPEQLIKRGISAEGVFFTNPLKEQLVNHLAMLVEQESIKYPNNEVLVNELKDYQYFLTQTGVIRYSASTSARHDDIVTAMMLAFRDYNQPQHELPYIGLFGGVKKKTFEFSQ